MNEVEQKVAEVPKAVTELIPAGKFAATGALGGTIEIRPDGSSEYAGYEKGFVRKVGEEACFENSAGVLCYAVADKGDGKRELSGSATIMLTPVP
ncbi:MAG: hypothetical protein FJX31_08765 [Alphaproteobacteria bacterium]|nr:hypothetical protein [Alphaproteobacteria bacterium]